MIEQAKNVIFKAPTIVSFGQDHIGRNKLHASVIIEAEQPWLITQVSLIEDRWFLNGLYNHSLVYNVMVEPNDWVMILTDQNEDAA